MRYTCYQNPAVDCLILLSVPNPQTKKSNLLVYIFKLLFDMSMTRNFSKSPLQNKLSLQSFLLLQNRIVTFLGTLDVLVLSQFTITSVELYVMLHKQLIMATLLNRIKAESKTLMHRNIVFCWKFITAEKGVIVF